jgi:hypothetical protein
MSDPDIKTGFRCELECLINSHSMENDSNTPDFVLAEFMNDCLRAFDKATNRRNEWYRELAELVDENYERQAKDQHRERDTGEGLVRTPTESRSLSRQDGSAY